MTGFEVPDDEILYIAEAGVNHNGDLELARQLVDAAADAGADAVKFQTFSADRLTLDSTPTADYQTESTDAESQRELLQTVELSKEDHVAIQDYCNKRGINFLSSPFDRESVELLESLDVPALKVGSGELTNHPFLRAVANTGRPTILSTGMATLQEVRAAVSVFESTASAGKLTLLHCVSAYPTRLEDVNLLAMQRLKAEFETPIGFSDHTERIEVPAFAVAAGAVVVEKHFTIDRSLPGPDQDLSLEPDELEQSVSLARDAARSLGTPEKEPVAAELETRYVSRRGVYAAQPLEAGDSLTRSDVKIRRPADGLSPAALDDVLGAVLLTPLQEDDPVRETDIQGEVSND